jgi:hypothetical protein
MKIGPHTVETNFGKVTFEVEITKERESAVEPSKFLKTIIDTLKAKLIALTKQS